MQDPAGTPDAPTAASPARGRVWLVVLLAVAVYLPALGNGFVRDGATLAAVHRPDGTVNELLRDDWVVGALARPYWAGVLERDTLYRPVTSWSFGLLGWLGGRGGEAVLQHLANLLLHGLATLLVLRLLTRLLVPPGLALLGGLTFGLLAIHNEVVAGVVGRAELLAFVGGVGGLLLLLPARGHAPVDRRRVLAAGAAFLVAFGAKESGLLWAAFAPVAVVVRAWRLDPTAGIGGALRPHLANLALALLPAALVYLGARQLVVGGLEQAVPAYVDNPLHHVDTATRLLTATRAWAEGLLLCVFPYRLLSDYSPQTLPLVTSLAHPAFPLSAFALLVALGAGLLAPRRRPLALLAVAAFFGLGLLTSNLLFPIGTLFGERLQYAPSLAMALLVVVLGEAVRRRGGGLQKAALGVLVVWLGCHAVQVLRHASLWRDEATLTLHEVAVNPASSRMQGVAGTIREARGDAAAAAGDAARASAEFDAAEAHYREALRLVPTYATVWMRLGDLQLKRRNRAGAEDSFRRGLASPHMRVPEESGQLHARLGGLLLRTNRAAAALPHLRTGLAQQPGDANTALDVFVLLPRVMSGPAVAEVLEEAKANLRGQHFVRLIVADELRKVGEVGRARELVEAVLAEAAPGTPAHAEARRRL